MSEATNWVCPVCGAVRNLTANTGGWGLICPNRYDGKHPEEPPGGLHKFDKRQRYRAAAMTPKDVEQQASTPQPTQQESPSGN